MPQPSLLGLTFLLLCLPPQQFPPLTTNQAPHPEVERRLPIDQPEVVTQHGRHRRVDRAQVLREANELANLADDIPSSVQQANKGLLPKDLNQRLKRIEKLAKQLRQELTQ